MHPDPLEKGSSCIESPAEHQAPGFMMDPMPSGNHGPCANTGGHFPFEHVSSEDAVESAGLPGPLPACKTAKHRETYYPQYFPNIMSPAASTPPSSTTQMSLCRRSAREILLEQLCKPSMRSLGNQYPLRCAHCGMTFIHQIHLTAHMRLHQAVPYSSVKCRECDTTCADDLSLQDHLDKAHSSGRGAFAVKFSISERIAYGHPDSP
eukprot:scpid101690/ scgid6576/ 